jgi:acyl carrier protein
MPPAEPALTIDIVLEAINDVLRYTRVDFTPVKPDMRLDEVGFESMELIEIFVLIEERTGMVVSTEGLPYLQTISDLKQLSVVDGAPPA